MGIPALVYVGPTMAEHEVLALLPGAQTRPPIRRGDLYRDRTLRHSVFVVIDGVFHQHDAIPPREIIDVIADGGWVLGASSMGAIRAAECWPAGMEGAGSIYRLFRRGSLGSDDEVAVAFDAAHPQRSSVPLINVRFAVSSAVRRGELDRSLGRQLVALAVATHYPERHWRALLRDAGAVDEDRSLERALAGYDLKKADAARALRRVARRLSASPGLVTRARRGAAPFNANESYRERDHCALDGLIETEVRPSLARFLVASGRADHDATTASSTGDDATVLTDQQFDALAETGDLDAEIFRWRAVRDAGHLARRAGLSCTEAHRAAADTEVARRHGCGSWRELEARSDVTSARWAWVLEYREQLTWAKCLRDAMFRSA